MEEQRSATVEIEFPGTSFERIKLDRGSKLSENLNSLNSPVLFGCRTGICGTCLIEAEAIGEDLLPELTSAEADLLPLIGKDNPKERLACQMPVQCSMKIKRAPR